MQNKNFKPIAVAMRKPAKKIGGKKGFHDQTLLAHWEDFVGTEIASICQPREIRGYRGRGSTLVLDCVSARASELAMRAEEIRMRVNSGLGFEAVAKIQLNHQHIGFDKKPDSKLKAKPRAREIPAALSQKLAGAQSEELRKALQVITYSFYNKES